VVDTGDHARYSSRGKVATPMSTADVQEPATYRPSATELAMRDFLGRVAKIPNAVVTTSGATSLVEQIIRVEVPSLLGEEARRVVHLQNEMYRKYRGARLRVDMTDTQAHAASASVDDHAAR
jgi:hypothetical protein